MNHDVWLKNLEALYKVDARFAQEIDDRPETEPHLTVEPARNGSPTIKARLPEGGEIYLHSKFDPQAEAAKFADGLDLKKNFVFVVSGLGLGYQVREIFNRTSNQTVTVVMEPEPGIIRAALAAIDFAEEIRKYRLIFLHQADKGRMHARLTPITATTILGTKLVNLSYTRKWHADFHSQMQMFFTDYMAYAKMAFLTTLGNCRLTQQNVSNNLVSYVGCPPINFLRRRFAGHPAVLVSAGPSLAKNRHLLKQAKGKAVIIAVQTVLKPLINLGVPPDFVTSLDYSPVSKKFFEGIDDFGDVVLVAEPKATWSVIDTFTGKKTLLANDFAALCLGPGAGPRDGLRAGSTVAHLSFYLAEYLGADPIILIGQDLAFSGNMYYAPGNVVHDMWGAELNRFQTLEMKEWERILRNRDILKTVTDIHGRRIYTDDQMFTYLQQFERDFAASPARVIDATEGGAHKRNTTAMTLAEALDLFAKSPIPADKFDYLEKNTWFDPQPLANLQEQMERRIGETKEFKEFCEKTVTLLDKLQASIDDPAEFNRLIIQVDEIRSLVNTHLKALQMVCSVSAMAEMRRFLHDRNLEARKKDLAETERAKDQLTRDLEYIKALVKGSDELIDVLEKALDRIRAAREHK